MKKTVFTTAMLSALLTCSVPITTHAADATLLEKGNGYVVIGGQNLESLQQTLKDIFENLGNNNIFCPVIPETPDNQKPDTSTQPDNQQPDTPAQPDNQQPGTSTQPDNQKPDTPAQPDTEVTGVHPYAVQILNLVNAERAKAGLSELKLDLSVTAAANVRANEIKQSFSHTRPDGSSFSSALKEQGVSYKRSGENIAWGQKSPEQVMNAWMNSDGHRANILNKNFENIGIGYYEDENGVKYWVQLFTA